MTNLRERRIESTAGAAREREEGLVMRKGPWTVEEDEVLLDYVRKYGPRDWSSIRNKGLLPRTGKSCRLRWVNKLKPNLKTGCKFSAEEERVVIELQAQFGNKWAKIATYLPGRTDNDVKNFWSTRQKRLARMLQSPKPHKNAAKMNSFKQMPDFESPAPIQVVTFDEGSSSGNQSCQPLFTEHLKTFTMVDLPDLISQAPLNQDSDLPSYDMQRADQTLTVLDPSMPLPLPLPPPAPDLPLLPEDQDFIPELMDPGSMDMFICQSADDAPDNGLGLHADLRMLGVTAAGQSDIKQDGNPRTLDSFFDDLPSDMFDCIDPISASSQWQNGPGGQ